MSLIIWKNTFNTSLRSVEQLTFACNDVYSLQNNLSNWNKMIQSALALSLSLANEMLVILNQ